MKILQFPLTKITIFFIIGVLVSYYGNTSVSTALILLFISFFVFCLCFLLSKKHFIQKIYFGISVYLLSFSIGILNQVIHTDYFQKDNYINQISNYDKEHLVEIVLREKLKSTKFSDRYIANIKLIDYKKSSGKILINFYNDKLNDKLKTGSIIQFKGTVVKHKTVNNPDQFDYGKYLTHKSILAQMYVSTSDVKINPKLVKDIWFYSNELRLRIIKNLNKSGFSRDELNVVSALILGQKQDISPEILQDYQFAGAIHILSVSGLHVGFIILFLNFLLKPIPNTKLGAYLKLSIILASLWGFAILAGMSPSVIRSVTMFSFIAVGMHLKRKTYIYHTLLASLFFIVLCEPSFLFDVGFQLSYTALFFILWLQPLLAKIWTPSNKIIAYFWGIITVSFAAQIGVMPLSIYYFHQFPGLFFVTNLIILPGLGIIMGLGIFVMVLAAFNYVNVLLAKTLEWLIYILNSIINWIASFEQFIFQDISFNWYMLISLYGLIIATIIWFKKPNYTKVMVVLITIFLFQLSYFATIWNTQNQKELIIFNIKKSTLIGERIGRNVTLFSKDSINKNNMLQSYLVANFSKIKTQKPLHNLAYFKNKKIVIMDSLGIYPKSVKPNIILLTNSPKINLQRLFLDFKPEIVIADASNFKTYIRLWKATCEKEKIPFHATVEKGFYRLQ